VPLADDGVTAASAALCRDIVTEAAAGAAAVICWGSCASNGCIQARARTDEGTPIEDVISGTPLIKVPGCPPIAEVMAGVVVHYLTFGTIPQLDGIGAAEGVLLAPGARHLLPPAELRRGALRRVVRRRERESAATVSTRWGAAGPSPTTRAASSDGMRASAYPIQSGHGGIGCSEANFWDNGPFYQHLASFPASASRRPPTRWGGRGRGHGGRDRGARDQHEHRKRHSSRKDPRQRTDPEKQ